MGGKGRRNPATYICAEQRAFGTNSYRTIWPGERERSKGYQQTHIGTVQYVLISIYPINVSGQLLAYCPIRLVEKPGLKVLLTDLL